MDEVTWRHFVAIFAFFVLICVCILALWHLLEWPVTKFLHLAIFKRRGYDARLSNLAMARWGLGRPDQAEPLLRRSLTIGEATYGPDHPEVGTRLNNLAAVLRDLEQPDQAEPLLRRSLTIGEATYGPDDPYVAAILGNLAMVLQDLGQGSQKGHIGQER